MTERDFWFDTRDGSLLVGEAAFEVAIEQSAPGDVVQLAGLLALKQSETLDLTYTRLDTSNWTADTYRQHGHWLLRVINTQEERLQPLRIDHLRNANRLGLGPGFTGRFLDTFGTFHNYKHALGLPATSSKGRFSDWEVTDYVLHARQIATNIHRKPQQTDYDRYFRDGKGPSVALIKSYVGSIHELNDLIGYPNITAWDDEDYITWGARVLRANQETGVTNPVIQELSKRKRGPSDKNVRDRFGKLSILQQLIEQRIEKENAIRASKLGLYRGMIKSGRLPETITELDDNTLLVIGGRMQVIRACLPYLDLEKQQSLAVSIDTGLIWGIKDYGQNISSGAIETEAEIIGVFDDVFPIRNTRELVVNLPRVRRPVFSRGTHRRASTPEQSA